jgi:hypothetical protein
MFVRKSLRPTLLAMLTAALFLASCTMGATPAPTVDVNAINTAAVATAMGQLSAQFTQTALAAPSVTPLPTNTAISLPTFAQATVTGGLPTVSFNSTPATPLPGFTALPTTGAAAGAPTAALGDACNNSVFEGDITIPDGTVIEGGTNFQKVWAIRNTGTCTWDDGYALVYIGGSTNNLDPYNYQFGRGGNDDDFVSGGEGINIGINLTAPCAPGTYEGHWRMRSDTGYYFGTVLSVYIEVKESDCD